MIIYLVIFSITIILVECYQKSGTVLVLRSKRMEVRWLFIATAVLLLSLLAALRALGVGTDTITYGQPTYELMRRCQSIRDVLGRGRPESGYALMAYLSVHILDDVHMLYFLTELMICAPVFYFITHWPREREKTLMLAGAWLFIYYTQGYNMMRQWMAMGFCLCASMELMDGRKVRFWVLSAIAATFHYSAVIMAGIFFLILFLQRGGGSLRRTILVVLAGMAALSAFNYIVPLLINVGFLNAKYSGWQFDVGSTVMQVLSRVPVLVGFTVFYKELYQSDERNKVVYAFLLLDMLCAVMVDRLGGAMLRVGPYFGIWQCAAITELHSVICGKVRSRYRIIITVIFFAILLFYWWLVFAYRGYGQSVPYRTDVF